MSNDIKKPSRRKAIDKEVPTAQAVFANGEVEEKQTQSKTEQASESKVDSLWSETYDWGLPQDPDRVLKIQMINPNPQSEGRLERPKRISEEIPLHPATEAFIQELERVDQAEIEAEDEEYTPDEAVQTLMRVHGYNQNQAEKIVNDALYKNREFAKPADARRVPDPVGLYQQLKSGNTATITTNYTGTVTTINAANGQEATTTKKVGTGRKYALADTPPPLYQPIIRDGRSNREIEDERRAKETEKYLRDITVKLVKAGYEVISPEEREERDKAPVDGEEMIINICELADHLTNQKLTEKYGDFKLEDIESEYDLTYEKFVNDITTFKRNKNG